MTAMLIQNQVLTALLVIGLPFLLLLWYLQRTQRPAGPALTGSACSRYMAVILIACFASRICLACFLPGHTGDLDYFRQWAYEAYARDFAHFYDGDFYCDYPPLYIYMLHVLGGIRAVFGLDYLGTAYAVVLRIPAIAADMILAYVVYRMALRRWGKNTALTLCVLVAFNPASLLNSGIWGQIDSILVLFLLGVFWMLYTGRYLWGAVLFMAGLLLKPQCLFAGPVVFYAFVGHIARARHKEKAWLDLFGAIAIAAAMWFLIPLPFGAGRHPLWLLNLYGGTISTYPYATYNAFNAYGVFGLNLIDAQTASFGGLNAQQWGIVAVLAICLYAAWLYRRARRRAYLFVLAGFVWASVFTLVHSMHERYLFAAPFLLLAGYILMSDPRLLDSAVMLWGILLIDEGATLIAYAYAEPIGALAMDWMSLLEVICWIYIAWAATDIALHGPRRQHPPAANRPRWSVLRQRPRCPEYAHASRRSSCGPADDTAGMQPDPHCTTKFPSISENEGRSPLC